MKRASPILLGTMLLAASGATAAMYAQRVGDDADERRAHTVANLVAAPRASEDVFTCHGDGIAACWHTPLPVAAAADGLVPSLAKAARTAPTRTCDRVPVGSAGAAVQADACFLRVRYGKHGVFVFVDPLTERDAHGLAQVVGSRVTVQAA